MEKDTITVEDLQESIKKHEVLLDRQISFKNFHITSKEAKIIYAPDNILLFLEEITTDLNIEFYGFQKITIKGKHDTKLSFNNVEHLIYDSIIYNTEKEFYLSFNDNFNRKECPSSNVSEIHFSNCSFLGHKINFGDGDITNFENTTLGILNCTFAENAHIQCQYFQSINILNNKCKNLSISISIKEKTPSVYIWGNDNTFFNNITLVLNTATINEIEIGLINCNTINMLSHAPCFKPNLLNLKLQKVNIAQINFKNLQISKFEIPQEGSINRLTINNCIIEELLLNDEIKTSVNELIIFKNSSFKELSTSINTHLLDIEYSTIEKANFYASKLKIGKEVLSRFNKDSIAISNTCQIELKEKDDIDTINILRYMFKDSNYHEYLQYNALSQNYLLEDKEGKLKCRDKVLLWLNKNSNEFGTNWWKGVKFTFISGSLIYIFGILFSYILFCAFFKSEMPIMSLKNWSRTAMGLLEFITSADLFQSNEKSINTILKNSNPITLLIYILGKFCVMYGIYQTIQAFRKYRN